jgi:2-methylcitrate synthase
VPAGNTALFSVGHLENVLHYRECDIFDLATYQKKLQSLRGLPAQLKAALKELLSSVHPMDIMGTGVSVALRLTR